MSEQLSLIPNEYKDIHTNSFVLKINKKELLDRLKGVYYGCSKEQKKDPLPFSICVNSEGKGYIVVGKIGKHSSFSMPIVPVGIRASAAEINALDLNRGEEYNVYLDKVEELIDCKKGSFKGETIEIYVDTFGDLRFKTLIVERPAQTVLFV